MHYPCLNQAVCCGKGICTECFLQVRTSLPFSGGREALACHKQIVSAAKAGSATMPLAVCKGECVLARLVCAPRVRLACAQCGCCS